MDLKPMQVSENIAVFLVFFGIDSGARRLYPLFYRRLLRISPKKSKHAKFGRKHIMIKNHFAITAVLLSSFSSAAIAGETWYSSKYNRYYEKGGYCGQYDYTDRATCNTDKDYLQCDWDHSNSICHGQNDWYSSHYNRWYDKSGHCSQYDYTDSDTCNTSKDHLQCNWDYNYEVCYPDSFSN
jgi:hypothetical protein